MRLRGIVRLGPDRGTRLPARNTRGTPWLMAEGSIRGIGWTPRLIPDLLAGGGRATAQGDQGVHQVGAEPAGAGGAHAQNFKEGSHVFLLVSLECGIPAGIPMNEWFAQSRIMR